MTLARTGTRSRTSGSTCARTGFPTGSSKPTKQSSKLPVMLGTNSPSRRENIMSIRLCDWAHIDRHRRAAPRSDGRAVGLRRPGERRYLPHLCRARPRSDAQRRRHRRDGQPRQPQRPGCPQHHTQRRSVSAIPATLQPRSEPHRLRRVVPSVRATDRRTPSANSNTGCGRPEREPQTHSGAPSAQYLTGLHPKNVQTTSRKLVMLPPKPEKVYCWISSQHWRCHQDRTLLTTCWSEDHLPASTGMRPDALCE